MPYTPAATLGGAVALAPRNTWFAHSDPGENLHDKLEQLRDLFFGALDTADPEQALLFRWMVPLQYDIDLTFDSITGSKADDAWRSGRSVSQMCGAALSAELNGRITPALAAVLLDAYNTAFS